VNVRRRTTNLLTYLRTDRRLDEEDVMIWRDQERKKVYCKHRDLQLNRSFNTSQSTSCHAWQHNKYLHLYRPGITTGFSTGKKLRLTYFDEVQLKAVVRPRREQHRTVLLVERKISHVDGTRAAEDDHRQPRDVAVWRHDDVRADGRPVRRYVGAENTHARRR